MCGNNLVAAPRNGLTDGHGRRIDYIRLSLTDRCNFRCVYCMPPEGAAHIPHEEILSYEELIRFCRISAALGISRYKITGGEPLCRKGAVSFMRSLKLMPGVEQVTLTTNGALLAGRLDGLAEFGLDGINVSLDTLSSDRYHAITRSGASPEDVLNTLQKAKDRGFSVKINAVPLKGYNDRDILPLARHALENGFHLRFIELMPVGRAGLYEGIPQETIKRDIENRFGPLEPLGKRIGNGPAEHFSVRGHDGSVGFISALSKKFCHSCNRVRLTSSGYLKTCLHHDTGMEIKPLLRGGSTDGEIGRAIIEAVRQKPAAHAFRKPEEGEATEFTMNSVGG